VIVRTFSGARAFFGQEDKQMQTKHIFKRAIALAMMAVAAGSASAQTLNEQQELIASLTTGVDSGQSVSISGATAVVGVPGDNSGAGDVYVYTLSGTTWTQQTVLTASDATAGDNFGASVSINGTSIAVGAPGRGSAQGAVYTFTFDGSNWNQNATILTNATGAAGDKLGASVSVQNFTVAAGSPFATVTANAAAGLVIIFDSPDSGTTWNPVNLHANPGHLAPNNHFGTSVSLSSGSVLIGAPNETQGPAANSGAAYVFLNTAGIWTQQARLQPGPSAGALFGTSVSLNVDTAAMGAPGTTNGTAYVFMRTAGVWSAGTALTASDAASGDAFGASVAVSGTGLVVGAPLANGAGAGSGKAYEFTSTLGVFAQTDALVATNNAAGDNFGASISLDAGYALVGAPLASVSTGTGNGAAYVFAPAPASIPTTTAITSITPEPSNIGQSYTVNVTVTANVGVGIPTGSVNIDDNLGNNCSAPLDLTGAGSCVLANSSAGTLTINANYPGEGAFIGSGTTAPHTVVGNHIVFMPTVMPNVLQDDQLSGVTVEVHDGSDTLVTSDNATQVTVSIVDPCGGANPIVFGTVVVTGGIADFTDVGPRFYTLTTGGALQLNATSDTSGNATSGTFDVVANAVDASIFADGFETCRL
jgi:hypothetical protein